MAPTRCDEEPDVEVAAFQSTEAVVEPENAGRRADVWIAARFRWLSRSAAARLLAEGRVEGLDRPLKPATVLQAGERIRLWRPRLEATEPPPPLPPILHEDARLVVFDKPAGMLAHPSGSRFAWALIGLARRARPDHHLHLVHRLDRDTSGITVIAKDDEANRVLKAAFLNHRVDKVYWAVVRGVPSWSTLLVDAPIGRAEHSRVRLRMAVRPDGLSARTRFHVLARFADLSLVAAHPRTGRTHQIRVHLEHAGHPVVGDRVYGQPDDLFLHVLDHGFDEEASRRAGFRRQALHARILRFPHPDGGFFEVRAPLAKDLEALLRART
ncbi:MAG: RluA family pseudouridine synthase [Deltaproteobacteria bacterium]|nr:RluA family pseudouridine synthase [Deltaproteobacteria bacterium]